MPRSMPLLVKLVATAAVLLGTLVGLGSMGHVVSTRAAVGTCATSGPSATPFPAAGRWSTVNVQRFNGTALPPDWDPFSGYFDGGSGQPHHSFREPSMLAFPGSWMEFKNEVYSNGADGSYETVADAGANEAYPETYDPATGATVEGYDVASHAWGFSWCARFNGGPGFDTAFAFVPVSGAWPPEIDFIEHGPSYGNAVTLHIHWMATRYNDGNPCDPDYPASNSQNCHANFPQVKVTVGHWHDYAVTWSSSRIDVWIDGRIASSLTVTPRICTQHADRQDGYHDTGTERLCLPNGYVANEPHGTLEPFVWDMQVNSYNGTTTYAGDQTDLAWFEALRPSP